MFWGSWRSSRPSSFPGSVIIIRIFGYYWFTVLWLVIVSSSLFVQSSESFLLIPTTTTTTTTTTTFTSSSTRHVPIHHNHQRLRDELLSNYVYSVRRHVGITVLSSQQQNTIEGKEKSETTKTRRKNRSWEESYQLLVSYKEKHGNCNVPRSYKDDSRLGWWVQSQRRTKDRLSDERIAKLDDLGFLWSNEIFEEQWEDMFEKLVLYAKQNNGDCNIPYNVDDNVNKDLCRWVEEQRKRKSFLSKERRAKLDKLGLIWEDADKVKADQKWNEQYESLKDYKEEHGHCLVPKRWEDDPALGLWVSSQRQLYKKGQLREDRQMKLEQMRFTWKVRDGNAPDVCKFDFNWFVKFGKLLAFHEEYGHCNVPYYYKKDKSLAKWVKTQRDKQKSKVTLQDYRKEMLDDIGLTWSFDDQKDEQWTEKYQDVKRFKEQNGHLRLPRGSILSRWAYNQRVQFAAGRVPHERKALLDEINFRWDI